MEPPLPGGTRWKRFAVVMVAGLAAAVAVCVGLAQGALAASFSVSGQRFKATAGHLRGDGLARYDGVDTIRTSVAGERRAVSVAISSFEDATITGMCQSARVDVPLLGSVYLRLEAGDDARDPVVAENLFIDVAQLDAATTGVGSADLYDVEQTAWATIAGTFRLNGLSTRLGRDPATECR
ncbi:DUF6230 family protein [Streptomyces sp. ZYX-F-203]